jgi:hypothetical protein
MLGGGALLDVTGASGPTPTSSDSSDSSATTTPFGCSVGNETCVDQELGSRVCHTLITTGWRLIRNPDPDVSYPPAPPTFLEYLTPSGTPAVMMDFQYDQSESGRSLRYTRVTCTGYGSTPARNIQVSADDYQNLLRPGTEADLPAVLR